VLHLKADEPFLRPVGARAEKSESLVKQKNPDNEI